MTESADLLDQKSHFAFGKNWASYATLVTDSLVDEAISDMRRLVGPLEGKRFLDIGCGSGLHALAALRLGAREVVALDIDPDSVATARHLLRRHAPGGSWQVFEHSVFDLDSGAFGQFDVVYSWGVLHHTGNMYQAVRNAATNVAPGGRFAFALYRRTHMCWFWKIEKRWYAGASARAQSVARAVYLALYRVAFAVARRGSFRDFVSRYRSNRGMDFYHDVHDWMGGWPYESISPAQVEHFMSELGMRQVVTFASKGTSPGVFGSGCDEYVYSRGDASAAVS